MIRWLVAGCLLFLTGVVCLAQIPTTGAGKAGPSSGGAALSWNPNSTQPAAQNAGYGNTATFSVTLDAAPATSDIIIVGLMTSSAGSTPVTSVTLNTSAMTLVSASDPGLGAGKSNAELFQITGITTPTLSIVVNTGGGLYGVAIAVGVIKNATSSTATATGNNAQNNQADPQNLTGGTGAITVPASGVGIFHFGVSISGTPSSSNSTILTAASKTDATSGWFSTMGYTTTAGSWNPNISGTSSSFSYAGAAMAAAAWH